MMKMVRFNPEINTGHLLQVVAFAFAALSGYVLIERRLTTIEVNQSNMTLIVKAHADSITKLSDNQAAIAVSLERISTLITSRREPK